MYILSHKKRNDGLLRNRINHTPFGTIRQIARRIKQWSTLYSENGAQSSFLGKFEGRIGYKELGKNGFGYDPVFYLPELGMTYAELPSEQKNAISHRARALQDFCRKYQEVQNHDK